MRAIIALTALVLSAAAAAESISSVDVTNRWTPSAAIAAQTRVVAIDDRPVVLQPGVVRVYRREPQDVDRCSAGPKVWAASCPLSSAMVSKLSR